MSSSATWSILRRAATAIAATALLCLAVAGPAGAEERLTGDGFTVPVPGGFERLQGTEQADQVDRGGGVVMKQAGKPSRKDAIVAHIVVVPSPPDVFDVRTIPGCKRIAERTAASTGGKLVESQLIEPPGGTSCQISMSHATLKNYRNLTTVMQGAKRFRTLIVCTRDRRDRTAEKACQAVVQGWQEADRIVRPRPRDAHGH